MSPPFIFRIDELGESPTAPALVTNFGSWVPSSNHGDNIRVGGGASGIWWICNGQDIRPLPNNTFPEGSKHYKTFSVFYCDGFGFWVMRGDATTPSPGETWQTLWFEHDSGDYSSYLTNAGTERRLRCQRPDQRWPNMLLPDIYHTQPVNTSTNYGGLKGDLAIFLALVALSMGQHHVREYLPRLFTDGAWRIHRSHHGRVNQRGVVVYVYTYPGAANSTPGELSNYEEGVYGKYYP